MSSHAHCLTLESLHWKIFSSSISGQQCIHSNKSSWCFQFGYWKGLLSSYFSYRGSSTQCLGFKLSSAHCCYEKHLFASTKKFWSSPECRMCWRDCALPNQSPIWFGKWIELCLRREVLSQFWMLVLFCS